MIWGISAIALWVITIIGYVMRNLIVQNNKLTKLVEERDIYINNIGAVIEDIEVRLREIDNRGTFASDDEVGFFFQQIQSIQTILNSFVIKNIENKK